MNRIKEEEEEKKKGVGRGDREQKTDGMFFYLNWKLVSSTDSSMVTTRRFSVHVTC